MDSPFKLLVYAIVALAILAAFYFIIWPLLSPQDGLAQIEKNLKASETMLGTGISRQLFFRQEEGFAGETFDLGLRSVSFQCNSAELCCPRQKECGLAIEWDNRLMKFNESKTVLTTTRCDFQNGLYTCRVYLGEEPAQIKIESTEMPEQFDLGKESVSFEIIFSNIGGIEAQQTEVSVEILRLSLEEGKWAETPAPEYAKTEATGKLKPNETIQKTVFIELNENGYFRAKIKASGLEAGFDEKTHVFEATGAPDACESHHCEEPYFASGKCTTRCYCEKCMLGSRCAQLLLQALPVDLGLHPGIRLDKAEPDILGSNIVDLELPDEMCPSDVVIEEPNAVINVIGFKLKNVSENRVQHPFAVNAYLEYGSPSQQQIGSVPVQPDEINRDGSVIKAITVSLEPGTYAVKLVANEDKTEKEEDYENNTADVTVEIPEPEKSEPEPVLTPTKDGLCCGWPIVTVRDLYPADKSDALPLRDAIKNGKIRADFEGWSGSVLADLRIFFKIQNMTKDKLKLKIPFGQIFTASQDSQNLAKGGEFGGLVIEIPVCSVYIGDFQAYCLNRIRRYPLGLLYDVGEVIKEKSVLDALNTGSHGEIWRAVEENSAPKNYGSSGDILRPVPVDIAAGTPLTKEECEAAGLCVRSDLCTCISDPKNVGPYPKCPIHSPK